MIYDGLTAALATQHGKETAVAPPFETITGLAVVVPEGIGTDGLGTFTGEVKRPGSMRDAARLKARMGMKSCGLPLGIASEGSFGPHPFMPFLATGREMMIFIDDTRGTEVVEETVTENTNFAALDLTPGADLQGFLTRTGFPAHAVVLRHGDAVVKGIDSQDELERLLRRCDGNTRIETDMRAHVNPTRMAEIGKLAVKLAFRMASTCPACGTPGFGAVRCEAGLPCAGCGTPTPLVRSVVCGCALCPHEQTLPRADGRRAASPAECPECNP